MPRTTTKSLVSFCDMYVCNVSECALLPAFLVGRRRASHNKMFFFLANYTLSDSLFFYLRWEESWLLEKEHTCLLQCHRSTDFLKALKTPRKASSRRLFFSPKIENYWGRAYFDFLPFLRKTGLNSCCRFPGKSRGSQSLFFGQSKKASQSKKKSLAFVILYCRRRKKAKKSKVARQHDHK